jgi:hypothetical protein
MLNNKRILCIGNNTAETDALTTQYALSNSSINYGLVTSTQQSIDAIGFYHTSLADFSAVTDLLTLVELFNHVIFFHQAKETYDDITAYHLTVHLINLIENRLGITVDRIDINNAKN